MGSVVLRLSGTLDLLHVELMRKRRGGATLRGRLHGAANLWGSVHGGKASRDSPSSKVLRLLVKKTNIEDL